MSRVSGKFVAVCKQQSRRTTTDEHADLRTHIMSLSLYFCPSTLIDRFYWRVIVGRAQRAHVLLLLHRTRRSL